ncbi:MAG: hypothetical protein ACO1N6_08790 [Microcella sp.]
MNHHQPSASTGKPHFIPMRLATAEDFTGDRAVEELRYARLIAAELTEDPVMASQVYLEMFHDPRGFAVSLQVLLVEVIEDVMLQMTATHSRETALEAVRATIAKIEGGRRG